MRAEYGGIEFDGIIPVATLVDALDCVFGYLDAFTPETYLAAEADCDDLFTVTHAHFEGRIFTRDEFPYFEAWREREGEMLLEMILKLPDVREGIVTLH